MKKTAVCFLVVLALCGGLVAIAVAPRHHVVTQNLGGNPYEFMRTLTKERRRGDTFELDGVCFSACTLVLSEIPLDHICATTYARLGFHAAFYYDGDGKRQFSQEATRVIWSTYPPKVRALLQQHGWSGPDADMSEPIMIEGDELHSLVKPCESH